MGLLFSAFLWYATELYSINIKQTCGQAALTAVCAMEKQKRDV